MLIITSKSSYRDPHSDCLAIRCDVLSEILPIKLDATDSWAVEANQAMRRPRRNCYKKNC